MRKRLLKALLIFTAAALGLAGALATFVRWDNCYGHTFSSFSIETMAPLPPASRSRVVISKMDAGRRPCYVRSNRDRIRRHPFG